MDSYNKNSVFIPNPISQVVSMPYALYLSLQRSFYLVGAEMLGLDYLILENQA